MLFLFFIGKKFVPDLPFPQKGKETGNFLLGWLQNVSPFFTQPEGAMLSFRLPILYHRHKKRKRKKL